MVRWEVGTSQEAGLKPGLPTNLGEDFLVQGLPSAPPPPTPDPKGVSLSQEGASGGGAGLPAGGGAPGVSITPHAGAF